MIRTARPHLPARRLLALLLLAMGTGACRDIAVEAGPGRRTAAIHADQAVYALIARFGPTVPDDDYDAVRARLAGSALVPSRLFRDTLIWTSGTADRRELRYVGHMTGDGYMLGTRSPGFVIDEPGDYRRRIVLDEVGEAQYRWFVRDELGLGNMGTDRLEAVAGALLDAAGSSSGTRIHNAALRSLPRTSAEVGRLFQIDSIATASLADGGSRIRMVFTMTPDGIEDDYPRYARYLDKYVSPLRLVASIADPRGADWVTASIDDRRFTLTLAVRDGRLIPLDGSRAPVPDSLRLEGEIRTRIGIFGIGATDLNALVALAGGDAPSLGLHFRDEPDWDFPPLVEGFLRSSLRRPFEGEGIQFILRLHEAGNQTIVSRDYAVTVQESTIVRWLGDLGATLTSDFRDGADLEFDHYNGEILRALRADLSTLLD